MQIDESKLYPYQRDAVRITCDRYDWYVPFCENFLLRKSLLRKFSFEKKQQFENIIKFYKLRFQFSFSLPHFLLQNSLLQKMFFGQKFFYAKNFLMPKMAFGCKMKPESEIVKF